MSSVVIVVPVYKEKMSVTESISWHQLLRVLGKYPIVFMAPQRLEGHLEYDGIGVEYFSNESFANVRSYSQLLLTPEFYERFLQYEYMLLYQLDAFVFSDRLQAFCELGYDFIGAPMPRLWWPNITRHTFNGGLSLRKISSCARVTKMRDEIFFKTSLKDGFERAEDIFFSYCGENLEIDFSVPSFSIGSKFSLQADTGHCYRKLSASNLPFGCHGWSKRHYFPFWRSIIEYFTGTLDYIANDIYSTGDLDYNDYRRLWIDCYYLTPRIMRYQVERAIDSWNRNNHCSLEYALWGIGYWGQDAIRLFRFLKLNVACIIDRNARNYEKINGVPLLKPDERMLKSKRYLIVITTEIYEKEIAAHLIGIGLKPNVDFFGYLKLKRDFINRYYSDLYTKIFQSNRDAKQRGYT